MSRRRDRRFPLTREQRKAHRSIREALEAAKGTGDYSAVRAAIADFLNAPVPTEKV